MTKHTKKQKHHKIGDHTGKPWKIHDSLVQRTREIRKKKSGFPKACSKISFIFWHDDTPKKCFYCGIPQELLKPLNWQHSLQKRLTIDRKTPNKGYVVSNMCFACERCNLIKNDFLTMTEMKTIAKKHLKPKWKKMYEKYRKNRS